MRISVSTQAHVREAHVKARSAGRSQNRLLMRGGRV